MRRATWRTRAAAAAIAAAGLVPAGCGGAATSSAAPERNGAAPREVRVVAAASGELADEVVVAGTLAAEEEVELGAKVAGRLGEILVDLGSRARRGQVLARLVPTDFELRVQQAEAALAQARARLGLDPNGTDDRVDVDGTALVRQAGAVLTETAAQRERARALWEEKLVPRADLDAAEAAWSVAESRHQDAREEVRTRIALLAQRRSELEIARRQLADSVLVAPFDGAVRERTAAIGRYLAVGDPIVTLVRTHPLRLRLSVPERASASIRVGQEVRISMDGNSVDRAGRVARLSPAIEERDRTLRLEAEVPNEDGALRPGAFVTARILTSGGRDAVLVPASSIVTFAGLEKLIVVKDGVTVERPVRTGRRIGEQVEILDGLEAGESVAAEPGNLVGGEAVTAVR